MRRIEKTLGGRTFALAVFLAVYVGLLAIVLSPREGIGASSPDGMTAARSAAVDLSMVATR